MNTLNRFFLGVLLLLLVVLGGVVWWQRTLLKEPAPPAPAANKPPPTATNVPAVAVASKAPASAAAREALQSALELHRQNKFVPARDALRQWLIDHPDSELTAEAETGLGEINIQIVTTPVPAPEKEDYTVPSGDSLARIAKKFNTTVELVKKSNRLVSDVIRVGDRLRVCQTSFSVVVDKTANTLTLLDKGKFFKKYRVGTGEYSTTPSGDFKIVDRLKEPAWHKDGRIIPYGDTNNVLGTHWLALNVPGYGIHGTWDEDSIGKQSSAGCVRLRNAEIEELFILLPYGTPVTIHE